MPRSRLSLFGVLIATASAVAPAMAETGHQRSHKRAIGKVGSHPIEAGGVCPLPDPAVEVPICGALQPSQCIGGLPGDTCLPQLVFFDGAGNPQAELCQCFSPNGLCGPVHVLPDPGGPGFRLLCDPNCPNGVDACTIHIDGVNTGQNLMDSTSVPPGALVSCDCASGGAGPCALPQPPIIPICDQNQAGGQCQTGGANDTCLPSIVITNDTGGFFAELCDCYPPSTDGVCGPVTIDESVGFPVFSCVEACPNPPGGNCEIHINGIASGTASVPVFDVPPNSTVTCACVDVVQNNFCVYEITCAEGDCTNCPAAVAGACFDAACPGGTCSVFTGMTASCGGAGATCCIEFGAFTCADPINLPPCPTVTNDCVCAPPQPGACCFPDGTCVEVLESACPAAAIWHGPGSTCGPIGACCDLATGQCSLEHQICCDGVWHQGDCQPLQACCLQDGTCSMLDPQCCVDLGGTAQGANSACSPSGPEACCFQDGTCAMLDPLCCAERGGQSLGAGSLCLGDLNGNGVDDACETQTICPLPAPPTLPICQQQQQGSCVAGGPNDLCLPSMLFVDAAGQLQAEICQCFIPGDDCGPIGVEQLPGTNEILLSCNGLCPIPTDDCLLHVGGVSTGQAQDVLSNLPAGAPITCECTQPPPQNFCVYEITCADGDCSNCPAAAAGACFDAACPNNTCQVLAGITTTCGGGTCCIEFGGFSCMDPAGLPPCPPLGNQCTCTPPQLGACCDILTGTCFDSFEADCPAPAIWQGPGTTCGPVGACCDPVSGACSQQFEGCCNGVWHPGPCIQPSRCCLGDSCIDIDPECCALLGGNAVSGTCQPTVACCFDDGTCADMDPVCCNLAGGNPQPAGSFCLGDLDGDGVDDACPPLGACCDLLFGSCTQTTQANCSGPFDSWLGAGTACLGDEACCFSDGTCSVMDKACCLDSGGSPQGPGSTCTSTGPEACCLPNDTCAMMDPRCCNAAGGSPQGVGSTCSATGPEACCQPNGVCTMLDPICCLAIGGNPHGAGSTCTSTGTQACCFANGTCAQMDPICCVDLGGLPVGLGSVCLGDGNGNGVDDACELPQVCEPLDDGSGCTPAVCPPDACFGECIDGSYCDDPACCIDPAACQCYAPNSVVSINLCGDCFGECTADGSYCDSGAPGCCIGGNCQCYSPNSSISIKLCGNCFGECIDGAYCDPVGNPACAIIPNQPACYDVFSQVSIDLCQSKPSLIDTVCETKCATLDAANGAWGITVCECVPPEECHVVLLPGADPFCDGVCPVGTDCVQSETVDPVSGNVVLCCNCEPIQACCLPTANVTCQQLPISQCLALGGTPQGLGSTCLGEQACCMPDGTCSFIDALCCTDVGGTPGGPGSTCLGEGACCLDIDDGPFQYDTCITADALCCETMGGVFQGVGSVCDTVACCLNGLCQDLDVECCLASGGVPQAAGSACEGDNNGNGVDDACEPDLCPLPLPPVVPICEQQQPGACIAGGPQDLCLPFIVFIDAAGQVQAEGCQCFSPGDNCGPVDVQPLAGTNETQLTCNGVCPIPDDDCLIHIGGVSTGLSQVIAANMPPGQAITCECALACPIPNPPLPEKKLATTCTLDADCTNLAVCINGDCYVPKNKYISLRPGNAGSMVALRVTMTSNALFPALAGEIWWVQPHVAGDPPDIYRLGCAKHYQDWATAPTVIHIGDQQITTEAVYAVQALTLGCDQSVPGNFSAPLSLPTVLKWGDAVGSLVAGVYEPPDGVANLNDVLAAVLKFQGSISPNMVWVDVDGDVPNANINIGDVFRFVLAFQGQPYPYPGPVPCP